jgi:hypothetical protein
MIIQMRISNLKPAAIFWSEAERGFEQDIRVLADQSVGSMISLHCSEHPVTDFASAAGANNNRFNELFHFMLDRGVYLPPSRLRHGSSAWRLAKRMWRGLWICLECLWHCSGANSI